MIFFAAVVGALALAAPVAQPTQTDFSRAPTVVERRSGLVFPRELAGLSLRWTQFDPNRIPFAPTLRYADTVGTRITIFVFRGAQPSVGLWFQRALTAQPALFAGVGPPAPPRILDGPAGPAGLATTLPVSADARARAVGIAVQQAGDWLLLAVAVSPGLDRAQLDGVLGRAIDELDLPPPSGGEVSLSAPAACAPGDRPSERGRLRAANRRERAQARSAPARVLAGTDLATRSAGWCRDDDAGLPSGAATLYRPVGAPAGRWVLLSGNVGWTLTSGPLSQAGDALHAVVLTDANGSRTESLSEGAPAPAAASAEHLQREE